MNAAEVLDLVGQAGGVVTVLRNGRLRVSASEPLPSDLLDCLRQHKPSVVDHLARPDLSDYLADFYERAAIAEYDGGLPREQAECASLGETLRTYERLGIAGQVRCGECQHFCPDPAGCGGIGRCTADGEGTKAFALPLYPKAQRHCRDFKSQAPSGR